MTIKTDALFDQALALVDKLRGEVFALRCHNPESKRIYRIRSWNGEAKLPASFQFEGDSEAGAIRLLSAGDIVDLASEYDIRIEKNNLCEWDGPQHTIWLSVPKSWFRDSHT